VIINRGVLTKVKFENYKEYKEDISRTLQVKYLEEDEIQTHKVDTSFPDASLERPF